MEDEPGCKCQRNCWSIVAVISEFGAVLRKDKLTTLDLQKVVGGCFFVVGFFFPGKRTFICIQTCTRCSYTSCMNILYIYTCMYTHICKTVYTQICTCFPTCVGRGSDWNRDSVSTLNHSGCANPPTELWLNFTGTFPSNHRNSAL